MAEKAEFGLGAWIQKPWGRTRTIFYDSQVEMIECEIRKGGFSSSHVHHRKHNHFHVISGKLRIEYESPWSGRVIGRDCTLEIIAGFRHSFIALEDTRLIEIYTSADGSPIDPDDIERFTENGIRG